MWRSAFVFYIATQLSQFVFVFFHASVWPNCRRSPRQILLSDLSTLHHQCKRQTLILLRLDRSFCLVLWSNCHQWMVLSACLPQIHHHPCNCIKISTRLVLRRTLGIPSKLLCYPVLSEAAGWGTPAIYARTPHISGLPPPGLPQRWSIIVCSLKASPAAYLPWHAHCLPCTYLWLGKTFVVGNETVPLPSCEQRWREQHLQKWPIRPDCQASPPLQTWPAVATWQTQWKLESKWHVQPLLQQELRHRSLCLRVRQTDRAGRKKREKYESIVRLTVAHNGEAVDQKLIFTYIRKCRVWNKITHQFISLSVKSRQAFLWDDHLKMQARYCWPFCDIHDLIHLSFCILVHVLCNMIFDSLTTQCCVVWPETAAEVWPGPNTIYSTLPDNNRYLGEWGGGGI